MISVYASLNIKMISNAVAITKHLASTVGKISSPSFALVVHIERAFKPWQTLKNTVLIH